MLRILLAKAWQILPVLFLVSLGSFFLLELVPGDPAVAVLGDSATPEQLAQVREQLGLDEPLVQRYTDWITGMLTGDLGQSIFPPHRSVTDLIAQRLPVTLEIAALTIFLSLLISIPLALRSAYRPGDPVDRVATTGAFAAISVPSFLAGLLLVYFLVFNTGAVKVLIAIIGVLAAALAARSGWPNLARAVGADRRRIALRIFTTVGAVLAGTALIVMFLPDFPRQGFARITEEGLRENLKSVALPVATLTLTECAVFVRVLRSDLIETLGEDYVLAARAKGMPAWRVLFRDALRPSLFSLITVVSVTLGRVVGGSVIVEMIFNLPGMGRLTIDSITTKDYPVVQACVLLVAVVYVLSSAAIDVMYAYLDPRIRRG